MIVDEVGDVSIVICAYTEERWSDLLAAVASIQQQSILPRETIVVIDHNRQLFERAQAGIRGAVVIESNEPRGLSGARNSGIAVTKGTLIAFLDDDAIADPDWLVRLSQHFEDQKVLGVGGAVEPLWVSKQPGWFPEEFYWVVGCSYLGLPQSLSVVRNPYGGCACFRREVFEGVGEFRDGIGRVGSHPTGGEETELCIRASQHWPERVFLYDPQAKIHHRIPAHRASWRYFRLRCYAEGKSKAVVAKYVGAKDGLSSEGIYIYKTLFQGISRGLKDFFVHLDLAGLLRIGAIVVGFLTTTIGYMVGTAFQHITALKKPRAYANSPLPVIAPKG